MSSLSTPTRLGRGLIVPGIDTRPTLDKVNTSLSYGGLHTPPSSAHESRRPSLQYAALSEAPFSASSYTHSQPVTPIHGLNQATDFFSQRWPQSVDTQKACCTPVDQSLQTAFPPDASYHGSMVDDAPVYAHLDSNNNVDNLGLQPNAYSSTVDSWARSQTIPASYAAHNACLGSTLFPIPHEMNVPANSPSSVFDHPGQPLHAFNYQYPPSHNVCSTQEYGNPASLFQSPQVVVPSQLSPQDNFPDHQVSNYATPSRHHEQINCSFSSGSVSFNDYEMVRPPSPMDVYFAHSEDEDYLMVKSEEVSSPILGYSIRSLRQSSIKSKRRASRRTRKAGTRATLCRHEFHGCEFECQGQQCLAYTPADRIKFEPANSSKQYQCKHVEENGTPCNARFDRMEHLKRHAGKHSSEKKYPCPLEGCGRAIGRPDNAGDHFKTHLRPKKPGKRNAHFEWHKVHDAIWNEYEDKKVARKLLEGLRRWIDNGMPDTTGNKRRQMQ